MEWRKELRALLWLSGIFAALYFMPLSDTFPDKGLARFDNAVLESLALVQYYARKHVLLCLIPAYFIAGGIGAFVRRQAVMRYLGPDAGKPTAYGVAAVSGTLLAVCSCTILPLFAGIYRMGAGLGPAATFLYSGPAISVLAIVLTMNVLGADIGIARAAGAVALSVVIGLCMHFIFRKDEATRRESAPTLAEGGEAPLRPMWQTAVFFAALVGVLVFANWKEPRDAVSGAWFAIWSWKWRLTAASAALFGVALAAWFKAEAWKVAATAAMVAAAALTLGTEAAFVVGAAGLGWIGLSREGELRDWIYASWGFARQILPLLLFGVMAAGFFLGRVGREGVIPSEWIADWLGGNTLGANLFAGVAGALMYFATLTEVPIIQGLQGAGMGKGPALTLLLAGPALSLPAVLVIKSVMGWRKTAVFVSLIVVFSTVSGWLFGMLA